MLLVRADKQAGGKSVKAPLVSSFSCFKQTKFKAILTALRLMPHYLAEVVYYVITLGYNQWQIHFLSQRFHRLQAVLVLRIGMDIRVIPQGADLVALLPPVVNGIGSAVSATAVN